MSDRSRSRSRSPDRVGDQVPPQVSNDAPPADEQVVPPVDDQAPPSSNDNGNGQGAETGEEVKLYVGNLDYGEYLVMILYRFYVLK
jgi:hypothetical protein